MQISTYSSPVTSGLTSFNQSPLQANTAIVTSLALGSLFCSSFAPKAEATVEAYPICIAVCEGTAIVADLIAQIPDLPEWIKDILESVANTVHATHVCPELCEILKGVVI